MEIFNEDNPFIGASPEDIAYYGLQKKQEAAELTREEKEEDRLDNVEGDNDDEEN